MFFSSIALTEEEELLLKFDITVYSCHLEFATFSNGGNTGGLINFPLNYDINTIQRACSDIQSKYMKKMYPTHLNIDY